MYDAIDDPYCYRGTPVLKNKLGILDANVLEAFEEEITRERAAEPLPRGRLSVSHYQAIHRHLFQDVYDWAGQFRTVRISKGGSMFCYPEHIRPEMKRLFGWLKEKNFLQELSPEEFSIEAARFLADLNAIHSFRDGNGRVQLAFMALIANQAGHTFALDELDPEGFLAAMILSFKGDERSLARQIQQLIQT